MKLTREKALKLHGQMWADMMNKLGDNPSHDERTEFKRQWCYSHFPDEDILCNCFLCEYDWTFGGECNHCPIDWGDIIDTGCVRNKVKHCSSPISEILALPERIIKEEK